MLARVAVLDSKFIARLHYGASVLRAGQICVALCFALTMQFFTV